MPGVALVPGRMERPAIWSRDPEGVLPVLWFCLRIFVFLFIYIWIRGTLPRFRYDQLMAFGWKFLLPLAIANLVITAFIVAIRS